MSNNQQTIGLLMGIYNEAGRIRACLQYHMPYVDEAVIVIQESDDGTEAIVDAYIKENPQYKIEALHFPKMGCSEATLQYGADCLTTDWVLYVDADEQFPKRFLQDMHQTVSREKVHNGYRFQRDNYFDIQIYNEAVPIEPKTIQIKHPARDSQVRLTRRSVTVFPPQIHVRARCRDESGQEQIISLPDSIYHLKTLDEQWIDNKSYVEPVAQVERFEAAKKQAKEAGLSIEDIKLENF